MLVARWGVRCLARDSSTPAQMLFFGEIRLWGWVHSRTTRDPPTEPTSRRECYSQRWGLNADAFLTSIERQNHSTTHGATPTKGSLPQPHQTLAVTLLVAAVPAATAQSLCSALPASFPAGVLSVDCTANPNDYRCQSESGFCRTDMVLAAGDFCKVRCQDESVGDITYRPEDADGEPMYPWAEFLFGCPVDAADGDPPVAIPNQNLISHLESGFPSWRPSPISGRFDLAVPAASLRKLIDVADVRF